MQGTDFALFRRWQQHQDAEAFHSLMRRYADMVYAVCFRVLGNAAEAEDIAQECFAVLAQTAQPPRKNLGSWLHSVAVNRAKDYIKADTRRKARETRYAEVQPAIIEVDWDDILEHVDSAIDALPEKERLIIIAQFLEGRSQKAIAAAMNVSRQTIRKRSKQGIEGIRTSLRKAGITVPAAVITAGFTTQSALAAPASLTASLGKMALSATPHTAKGGITALLGGGLLLKAALALCVLIIPVAVVLWPPSPNSNEVPASNSAEHAMPPRDNHATETIIGQAAIEELPTAHEVMDSNSMEDAFGILVGPDDELVIKDKETRRTPYGRVKIHYFWRKGPDSAQSSTEHEPLDTGAIMMLMKDWEEALIFASAPEANLVSNLVTLSAHALPDEPVVLKLQPGASVKGRLLDAMDTPLADSYVMLSNHHQGFGWVIRNPLPGLDMEFDIDTQGYFSIQGLPQGSYTIVAYIRGLFQEECKSTKTRFTLAQGDRKQLALKWDRYPMRIAGQVIDPDGRPINDVILRVHGVREEGHLSNEPSNTMHNGTSDIHGRFEIPVFGPATVYVNAEVKGFERQRTKKVKAGKQDIEIILEPFQGVDLETTIQVKADVINAATQEPLDTFEVAVIPGTFTDPIGFSECRNMNGQFILHTDRLERNQLPKRFSYIVNRAHPEDESLNSGKGGHSAEISEAYDSITIVVRAEGMKAEMQQVSVYKPFQGTLQFALSPDPGMHGRIVNERGEAVSGASIFETPYWHGQIPLASDTKTVTDTAGAFSVIGLVPTAQYVYVYHNDYLPMRAEIAREGEWVITLSEGSIIEGTVQQGGNPYANVDIELNMSLPEYLKRIPFVKTFHKRQKTDAEGRYRFSGIYPGEIELSVRQDRRRFVLKEQVTHQENFDFQSNDAIVHGRVLVGDAPAVGTVQVLSYMPSPSGGYTGTGPVATLDEEGRFVVEDAFIGEADIVARLQGRLERELRQTVHLNSGENPPVELVLAPGTTALEGDLLLDQPDSYQLDITLTVHTASGPENFRLYNYPHDSGYYLIEGLPAGTAEIQMKLKSGEQQRAFHMQRTVDLIEHAITRYDISGDTTNLIIDVANGTSGFYIFPGFLAVPDGNTISLGTVQAFLMEYQPVYAAEARMKQHLTLEAGDYTVLLFGHPDNDASAPENRTFPFESKTISVSADELQEVHIALPKE